MKISGKINEVHNLMGFMQSYYLDKNSPDKNTFNGAKDITVYIAPTIPLPAPFFPNQSLKVKAGSNGSFSIDVSSLNKSFSYYLLAYKQVGETKVLNMTIPIYHPVYRSAAFKLKDISNFNAYYSGYNIPKEKGITDAQISEKIKSVKDSIKELKKVTTNIRKGHIYVKGEGKGATVTFEVALNPYTGSDLNRFIKHKMNQFDVDLPGPDFITSLCVDEDEIEKEINGRLYGLMGDVSKEILDTVIAGLSGATGIGKSLLLAYFQSNATMTIGDVDYEVLKVQKLPVINLEIKTYAIVPSLNFGFPREVKSQGTMFKKVAVGDLKKKIKVTVNGRQKIKQ